MTLCGDRDIQMNVAARHLLIVVGASLLLARSSWCQCSPLDNNLQVVDLTDLDGDLPLDVVLSSFLTPRMTRMR